MASAYSLSIEDLTNRRKAAVQKNHFSKPVFALTCPDTRIGVVVTPAPWGGKGLKAYYFKPGQMNRSFQSENIASAHDQLAALDRAKTIINAEKAEKVAPHDFKVGDIIAAVWGSTMRDVNFYKVVDASKPREIQAVELGSYFETGDWMNGTKMPLVDQVKSDPKTFKTQVRNGTSYLKTNSITTARKWDEKAISIYCD